MISENEIQNMLPVRDVARLLSMHCNTVRRWSDKGILRAYRINTRGDRRFRQEDVTRIKSELKTNGGSPSTS